MFVVRSFSFTARGNDKNETVYDNLLLVGEEGEGVAWARAPGYGRGTGASREIEGNVLEQGR